MMLKRRDFKFSLLFVIALTLVSCRLSSLNPSGYSYGPAEVRKGSEGAAEGVQKSPDYGPPSRLAVLEDKTIDESSGLAASRLNPGVFWTHNDSGDGPYIYAFDRQGRERGTWQVRGAQARDWEDMAAGPGPERGRSYLYIGDTGDNQREREQIVVYRVAEPAVAAPEPQAGKKLRLITEPAEAIRLKYPDGRHDAETLMVHPTTGDLYIVTKSAATAAGVYKLAAPFDASQVNTLARVAEVRVPGPFGALLTGGDISPDGRRLVLCDYLRAYELTLPADATAFEQIWKQPTLAVELGERVQGESVCYAADGEAIFATSEKLPTPLIEVKRLRQK